MNQSNHKNYRPFISPIVSNLVILVLTGLISYKLIVTPFNLILDFSAVLSLLLAFFAVALSALFYFKATETSNAFYDNTYKFTKDITDLLVRIESGFGERLRHLDESYTRIQDRFMPSLPKEEVARAKDEIKREEDDLQVKLQERDMLINELAEKANIEVKEKDNILAELKKRDLELHHAQRELELLRMDFKDIERHSIPEGWPGSTRWRIDKFTRQEVLPKLTKGDLRKIRLVEIVEKWQEISDSLPRDYLNDLISQGFVNENGRLTPSGIIYMRKLPDK